jgi:hypothetical protein
MQFFIESKKYGIKTCYIDEEDYHLVNKYKWSLQKVSHLFYVIRREYINKKLIITFLHNQILNIIPNNQYEIDHIDNNGLNNQRNNLRKCTHAENMMHKKIYKNNKSGFKGIYLNKNPKSNQKWISQIRINKIKKTKYHFTKEEAIKHYNEMALKYFGEFAILNIIKE